MNCHPREVVAAILCTAMVACGERPKLDQQVAEIGIAVEAPEGGYPASSSFTGDEGTNPTAERRPEETRRVAGWATWRVELDTLDLRRKATLRIATDSPDSTVIVLRAHDSLPPAPGFYSAILPATGASHSDPASFHVDMRTSEAGKHRRYIIDGFDRDTIQIAGPEPGDTIDVIRGRLLLHGSRYADGQGSPRDYVMRDISGSFVAPRITGQSHAIIVTSDMQRAVLTRALDGFMITHSGASNGDGPLDSTRSESSARRFLESRWSDAMTIESLVVDDSRYSIVLRGRFVAVTCSIESSSDRIRCR